MALESRATYLNREPSDDDATLTADSLMFAVCLTLLSTGGDRTAFLAHIQDRLTRAPKGGAWALGVMRSWERAMVLAEEML